MDEIDRLLGEQAPLSTSTVVRRRPWSGPRCSASTGSELPAPVRDRLRESYGAVGERPAV